MIKLPSAIAKALAIKVAEQINETKRKKFEEDRVKFKKELENDPLYKEIIKDFKSINKKQDKLVKKYKDHLTLWKYKPSFDIRHSRYNSINCQDIYNEIMLEGFIEGSNFKTADELIAHFVKKHTK